MLQLDTVRKKKKKQSSFVPNTAIGHCMKAWNELQENPVITVQPALLAALVQ